MGKTNEPKTDAFFLDYITRYGRAFDNYDLDFILDSYHTPCFIFKGGKLYENLTEEIKVKYFKDTLESYRQEGYDKAEIPSFELKRMGDESVLITVRWLCLRSDGSTAFDFWDSYYLIRIQGKWKIMGDTVYDQTV